MADIVEVDDAKLRDDVVVPFRTVESGISGRLVRLGPLADDILRRHDYPDPVAEVMGEALALTALLGSQIKFNGRLIMQTRSDGPLGFFVTNYRVPGELRGYANFDAEAVANVDTGSGADHGALLGRGHLALTIDPGPAMDRYQGIVPLDGTSLSDAARTYFRQSEQLPTFIRLAVARHADAQGDGAWHWRAGGIMVQHVSPDGGKPPPEDAPDDFLLGDDDQHWQRVNILASTVERHELIDPTLSPERLLFRLFHEEGVRVMDDRQLSAFCQCSRQRVATFLGSFTDEDLSGMRTADGGVVVTCEFCGTDYVFTPDEVAKRAQKDS
ncbi:MAG: Hsp33 family molecular chaperone [Pseudomonadota bacterium]